MNAHVPPIVADEATVRAFIALVNSHAARALHGAENPGLLQLSRAHPAMPKDFVPTRFRIGDVEAMVRTALADAASGHNVYVEGRTVTTDVRGLRRGTIADSRGVYAFVVDSDADKGKAGARVLAPTMVVETSPGNRHHWYFLDRALTAVQAQPLGEAIKAAAGGDSNTGVLTQPYRVAGTPNFPGKEKLARGRIVTPTWIVSSDGPVWTAADLAKAFPPVERPKQAGSGASGDRPLEELLARCSAGLRKLLSAPAAPFEDRSATAFSVMCSLVRKGFSDAEIVRLFGAHPEGIGARYVVDGKDLEADIRRAREKRERPAEQADGPPIIRVVAGEIPRVVDEAERALIRSGLPVFSRAGALVRPILETIPAARDRVTTVAKFKELCADTSVDLLSGVAEFQRFDKRSEAWVTIDPPAKIASILLAREGQWHVPRAGGIITTPTIRPDGSVLSTPGYDPATRLYLAPDASLDMPELPAKPSRDDAEAALRLLLDLISGFPFVGAVDRAVALSGIVTAVVRGAMSVAPLHAIRAHSAGTGKSYLVDVASTIATGRLCPVIAAGKTEEETEKRLGSLLRDAVPIVSLDNVNGELGGDALCQMTERPLVRIRILGKTETPEFECKATIFATGNNLVLLGDMTRRTVLCSLDAGIERPELREFPFDPVARVLADRGRYVAATLTIAMAYRSAGSPRVCNPIGSYGEWSETVRAPLIWLGEADPVASMETARNEDPELAAVRELLGHWRKHLAEVSPYTTAQIIAKACDRCPSGDFYWPEFRDLLLRMAGEGGAVSSRKLGKWLSKISGKIIDRCRISMRVDGSHGNKFSLCPERST